MPGDREKQGPLRSELEKILTGIKVRESNPENRIRENWEKLAGKKISGHARPYALKNRTLFIRADSAPWAYEIANRYKAFLMKQLRESVGEGIVKDICVKVGELS